MSRLKKADIEKIKILEQSVINDSPEDVAKVYSELGEVAFTAHILGIACRFRKYDVVKILVENGATFKYDAEFIKYKYFDLFGSYYPGEAPDFTYIMLKHSMASACDYILYQYVERLTDKMKNTLHYVSDKEFAKTVAYLCENAEKTAFNPGDFLYYMILSDGEETVCAMKDIGVTLSDSKQKLLTEGGRDEKSNDWYLHCYFIKMLYDKDFKRIVTRLIAETGSDKKLHFTEYFCDMNQERFFNPEFFGFFLEHFNQSKMNKTKLLKEIILQENVACLDTAIQNGWLKLPRKRDEMIQYAVDNRKTECAAFLLDFKNRTADFEEEEKREEKKLMRELNASPNSVFMLKKIWNFKKREDGTLVITGYKGSKTDIVVPEQIGKSKVTAIGQYAFSPIAYRLTDEVRNFRRTITQITLPGSITEIEDRAFESCTALRTVNIHDGLLTIGTFAFFKCSALKDIVLPSSLKVIGPDSFCRCESLESVTIPEGTLKIERAAFSYCTSLKTVEIPSSVEEIDDDKYWYYRHGCFQESPNVTAIVQKGSYAEKYCKENDMAFIYKNN